MRDADRWETKKKKKKKKKKCDYRGQIQLATNLLVAESTESRERCKKEDEDRRTDTQTKSDTAPPLAATEHPAWRGELRLLLLLVCAISLTTDVVPTGKTKEVQSRHAPNRNASVARGTRSARIVLRESYTQSTSNYSSRTLIL